MAEIERKIFHVIIGFIIIFLIEFNLINPVMIFLTITIGILISFIYKKETIKLLKPIIEIFGRKDEHPGFGAITYLIGVFLVLALFQKQIAQIAIMVLAVGDSAASVIGTYGKIKIPYNKNKTILGTIAGIIAATFASTPFTTFHLAFLASSVGMLVETLPTRKYLKLDDNIFIPLAVGLFLTLI